MVRMLSSCLKSPIVWGSALLMTASVFYSCKGDGVGVTENGEVEPSGEISAYVAVQAIFDNSSPACTGCHTAGGGGAAQLSLVAGESYEMLVGRETTLLPTQEPTLRVDPENPDGSFLYEIIASDTPKNGTRMPIGGILSDSDIETIFNWISCGAPGPDDKSVCAGVND